MGTSDNLATFWSFRAAFIPLIAFLGPLYLVVPGDEEALYSKIPKMPARCLYGIIVMAILWVTEAIPISATALIPIFLFPMLGVADAKTISGSYVTDTTMLFLGGLIVAVALEQSGLHRRISLGVMRIVGAQPVWLILGMMGTTWFLSMWISNTAATSMMIPIITAVISTVNELNQGVDPEGGEANQGFEPDDLQNEKQINGKKKEKYEVPLPVARTQSRMSNEEFTRVAKALTLCVAWGANMGGIATITGTPPNLVLQGQANEFYIGKTGDPTADPDITFAKWMGFAFPLSLIGVILAWLWLSLFFLRLGCFKRLDPETKLAINTTIRDQWIALGRITLSEIQVLIVFALLVVLWIFRTPPNIDGWGIGFVTNGISTVSDSTPCMLFSVLLFMLPADLPCGKSGSTRYKPILNWEIVHQKLPWGVIVLLGGGFAIAKASQVSGFSSWMGEELTRFSDLEPWIMNLVLCSIVAAVTEVTSNTATATLLLPIFGELALSTNSHPLYLMFGAAVSCSFAFMLPVATPPNAIVFSTKYITIKDMMIAGFPMNVLAILTLTLALNTWGKSMYDLGTVPSIFITNNSTA